MKEKSIFLLIIILATCFAIVQINIEAATRGRAIQYNIKSGCYTPKEIIEIPKLKSLPVPASNTNYAFYQSINKVSNVVIGSFNTGERTITLIKDKNADGKVDIVAHLFVDSGKISLEPDAERYCSAERFKKYKEDITNGNIEDISPNPEGISYLNELIKNSGNIRKAKFGYRVSITDTDEPSKERVSYFFSHRDISGADIIFEVRYYNQTNARVSPVINKAVYCNNSRDPFAIELAKKHIKEIQEKFTSYDY